MELENVEGEKAGLSTFTQFPSGVSSTYWICLHFKKCGVAPVRGLMWFVQSGNLVDREKVLFLRNGVWHSLL